MEQAPSSDHRPRLMQAVSALLRERRVAALGTVQEDGAPFVSMVPYAVEPGQACLVLHVSALAAHTANLLARPRVSLLVTQGEVAGEPVHALPRLTLLGRAQRLEPGSADWETCRAAYLRRFPEAEPMTQLGDFSFVAIVPDAARQIAGFGAARSVDMAELRQILAAA